MLLLFVVRDYSRIAVVVLAISHTHVISLREDMYTRLCTYEYIGLFMYIVQSTTTNIYLTVLIVSVNVIAHFKYVKYKCFIVINLFYNVCMYTVRWIFVSGLLIANGLFITLSPLLLIILLPKAYATVVRKYVCTFIFKIVEPCMPLRIV